PVNLQVLYRNGSDAGDTSSNTLRPFFEVVNADTVSYGYSGLTARYWFTPENYGGINTWIDYAALGSGVVQGGYVPLASPYNRAFGYVQYSFDSAAGVLTPGGSSGEIQTRIAGATWPVMNQNNDYSFANTASYGANGTFTLYRNGVLVWGVEPLAVAPVVSVQPLYENQNRKTLTNTTSMYLQVLNQGNVPLSYNDLRVRYWFTADGTAASNYWIDYAQVGSSLVTGWFVSVSPVLDSADTYFELAVDSSAGSLYPLSNTGNIQYRIAKSDWSNFNE